MLPETKPRRKSPYREPQIFRKGEGVVREDGRPGTVEKVITSMRYLVNYGNQKVITRATQLTRQIAGPDPRSRFRW